MDIERLVNEPALAEPIAALRERIREPDHSVSDVVDGAGHQYVDLVMEGGGMLGIALVGYTWALEEMGLRFLGIAGTSAGAINALLLAAMGEPADKKSPPLLAAMARLDFYRFVDGDGTEKGRRKARALIEVTLDGNPANLWKVLKLARRYWGVRRRLLRGYGLNRGADFHDWLTGVLASAGIHTCAELEERLARTPPDLRIRDGVEPPPGGRPAAGKLVIIASDVTTETRVEFPRMAEMYWADPAGFNPAGFARASMSIPLFFEPYRASPLPDTRRAREAWKSVGVDLDKENEDRVPEHALFVDGGITSNFPIDAFHRPGVPTRPTFGVKLAYDDRYKSTSTLPLHGNGRRGPLLALTRAIFNSARHTLDYEFVARNPDYRHLVQFIPCTYTVDGRTHGYNWIDFNMPAARREELFMQGARKAIEFVDAFSSATGGFTSKRRYYKDLRSRLRGR